MLRGSLFGACCTDREADLWLPRFAVRAVAAATRLAAVGGYCKRACRLQDGQTRRPTSECRPLATCPKCVRAKPMQTNGLVAGSWPTRLGARSVTVLGQAGIMIGASINPDSDCYWVRIQNVDPRDITGESGVFKGYLREAFEEAWVAYRLPACRYSATGCISTGKMSLRHPLRGNLVAGYVRMPPAGVFMPEL